MRSTSRAGSGISIGYEYMKLTQREPGSTWTMSPESSASPGRASAAPGRRRSGRRAAAASGRPRASRASPVPESIDGVGPHGPTRGRRVDQDRAVEPVRPLDHRRVVVRMRDRDRAQAAARLDERRHSSSSGTQSQRTLPPGDSTSSARCADPELGLGADARQPRLLVANTARCVVAELLVASPTAGPRPGRTGARPRRSGTPRGGASDSGNCVPHVLQRNDGVTGGRGTSTTSIRRRSRRRRRPAVRPLASTCRLEHGVVVDLTRVSGIPRAGHSHDERERPGGGSGHSQNDTSHRRPPPPPPRGMSSGPAGGSSGSCGNRDRATSPSCRRRTARRSRSASWSDGAFR